MGPAGYVGISAVVEFVGFGLHWNLVLLHTQREIETERAAHTHKPTANAERQIESTRPFPQGTPELSQAPTRTCTGERAVSSECHHQ